MPARFLALIYRQWINTPVLLVVFIQNMLTIQLKPCKSFYLKFYQQYVQETDVGPFCNLMFFMGLYCPQDTGGSSNCILNNTFLFLGIFGVKKFNCHKP